MSPTTAHRDVTMPGPHSNRLRLPPTRWVTGTGHGTSANRMEGSLSDTEAIRYTTGQTAIHLEFRWPSAWTRTAAHLDSATAADMHLVNGSVT